MNTRKKVLVVGTGAGGATIANKLQDNYDVTILEAGKEFHPFSAPIDAFASLRKTGLFLDERMIRLLLPNMQVRKSRGDGMVMDESGAGQRAGMANALDLGGDNGMVMVNGLGVGGTTTLATGNAVRCDAALKSLGIGLDAEFEQLCRELPITT